MAPVAAAELLKLLDDNLSEDQQREILSFVDGIEILELPGKPKMILTGWMDKTHASRHADEKYVNNDKFKVWTYASQKRQSYTLIHNHIVIDPHPKPHQVKEVYCNFIRAEYGDAHYPSGTAKPSVQKQLPRTVMLMCWLLATGETLGNSNKKKGKGSDGHPRRSKKARKKSMYGDDDSEGSDDMNIGLNPTMSAYDLRKRKKQTMERIKSAAKVVSDDSASEDAEGEKTAAMDDDPPRNGKGEAPAQDRSVRNATDSNASSEYDAHYEVWKAFMEGEKQDDWERIRKAFTGIFDEQAPPRDIMEEGDEEIQRAYETESPPLMFKHTAAYSRWQHIWSGSEPMLLDGDEEHAPPPGTLPIDFNAPAQQTSQQASGQGSPGVTTAQGDSRDQDVQLPERSMEDVEAPIQQPSQETSDQGATISVGEEDGGDSQHTGELPQIPEDADFATSAALINQIDGMNLPDDHPIFNTADYERLIDTVREHHGLTSLEELYRVLIWEDVLDESGRPYW